jgi:serine/threonine-protein kinase
VGGRYVVQRIVERGPLSMTVLSHDSQQRSVAIVVLYPGKATEDTVARFVAEARTASEIDSDHVARVHEVGSLPDGAPFVAMEYVAGTDLLELVSARGGALPVAVAADILLQAIDAVACARVHGVLHRDLRPGSMLLVSQSDGSDVLKVLDFDLSPVTDVAASAPNLFPLRRRLPVSHAYRAPERALDSTIVDPRADVWSLGAVLFLLVTGAPPFAEGTPAEVLGAIATRSPEALRARLRDLPGPLADTILRCLEPDRDRRFADIAELGEALVPYGTGARTEGARRARAAISGPPPSFLTTMPLHVITATPPPTLAFTPTPHAAMLVPSVPPPEMAPLPPPMPSLAPAPPPVRTGGPSGIVVAIVGGFLVAAIGGAIVVAVLLRRHETPVVAPLPVETASPVAASLALPDPAPPVSASVPSAEPSAEASAEPPPEPSVTAVVPAPTALPQTAIRPPFPAGAPVPARPSKSDLLRSRE